MDFMYYWQISDMVTKTLFFLLFALSIISWVIGILRVLQSRKLAANVADDLSQQIAAKQTELRDVDAADRRLITEQALLKNISRYRFSSERGLPILGTTAAIAPFIGLFGTVWGIFHALHNIGTSGQAGLGQVAGPVGEALIMTGLGIAVAIPAVVFYNLAVRVNRRVLYHANDRAHDLLSASTKQTTTPQPVAGTSTKATTKPSTKTDEPSASQYRGSAPSKV
ncbi:MULTISPECIES: MotA/TolQ/ExbB proton channel family protein [unclassified Psychrobacter]|uniref:MotA/TolQ/ExbB proton channel family protein n=1 Tax=Psychrobacter TaxID=497 RepID=UPI001787CFEB|nr:MULTISPECIES: MotA/TolQ/ExbB proton channel family protein [unclassified Psychrobacter]MBE0446215.1 MotA/TolQ/ExbB proton channel family protein [Psychrobacter sp. FME5]MDN5891476.1 MotA/TolQ/ExbB proton channel family protein [Psychrobacter sp.]MDN6308954.1 MotA/TolQ/ExbB proton channel family protein [Psychrobacter sp.]